MTRAAVYLRALLRAVLRPARGGQIPPRLPDNDSVPGIMSPGGPVDHL